MTFKTANHMADNFLEKQMDDYRNGRRRNPVSHSGGRRPGIYPIKYPAQTVAVMRADLPGGSQLITQLVQAGATVAFTAESSGTAIAQTAGGRFYPDGIDQLRADLTARNQLPQTIISFTFDHLLTASKAFPNASARILITDTLIPHSTMPAFVTILHNNLPDIAAIVATTLSRQGIRPTGVIRLT
ncbi:MAG: hypothetical protein ACI4AM_01400 [Muribaculaceae bacterium]